MMWGQEFFCFSVRTCASSGRHGRILQKSDLFGGVNIDCLDKLDISKNCECRLGGDGRVDAGAKQQTCEDEDIKSKQGFQTSSCWLCWMALTSLI